LNEQQRCDMCCLPIADIYYSALLYFRRNNTIPVRDNSFTRQIQILDKGTGNRNTAS